MRSTTVLEAPVATPGWLLPATAPTPAEAEFRWFESLYLHRSKAEDTAFNALRWLLKKLECPFEVAPAQDRFDADTILVTTASPLAVADTAAGLFILTGAFTLDQAEAFVGVPMEVLMQPVPVPPDVLTPSVEATTRFGRVTKGGYAWFWQQTADNAAVVAGAPARQGMVRANSETEAIDRLREHFTDVGAFNWIKRRDYTFPLGLEAAY